MPIFTSHADNGTLVHYISDTARMVTENLSYSIASITCGSNEVFILTADGQVWQYGDCFSSANKHVKLLPLPKITQMNCKNKHIYFVADDGTLYARGYNGYGQLGNGSTIENGDPRKIDTPGKIAMAACGGWHSIVLTKEQDLYGVGQNNHGQVIKLPSSGDLLQFTKMDITIPAPYARVECGGEFSIVYNVHKQLVTVGILRDTIGTTFDNERFDNFVAGFYDFLALSITGTLYHVTRTEIKTINLVGITHFGYGDHHFVVQTTNGLMASGGSIRKQVDAKDKGTLISVPVPQNVDQSTCEVSQICCGETFTCVVYKSTKNVKRLRTLLQLHAKQYVYTDCQFAFQ